MRFSPTKSQPAVPAWVKQLKQHAPNQGLMRHVWQKEQQVFKRFTYFHERLQTLSRRWRRALYRVLGVSLTTAAFLLAVGLALPAKANSITVDGTTCTLADAITAANQDTMTNGCTAGSGDDIIDLQTNIALTGTLPTITSTLTLNGNSFALDGDNRYRLLQISSQSSFTEALDYGLPQPHVTLNNITITNGLAPTGENGAGINVRHGMLTLNDSLVTGNTANASGGSIALDQGTAAINSSIIEKSSADTGGGLASTNSILTVTNSTIQNNTADNGAGLLIEKSEFTILDTQIISNVASTNGGGLYIYGELDPADQHTSIISGTLIKGNEANYYGGGLSVNYTTMSVNQSSITSNETNGMFNSGTGAGLEIYYSTLTMTHSNVSGNHSTGAGGGIYQYGNSDNRLVIQQSTISGNEAEISGGGIALGSYYASPVHIEQSTIALNHIENTDVESGGGLFLYGAALTLSNTIVSGNTADTHPSEAAAYDLGTYGSIATEGNLFGTNGLADVHGFTIDPSDHIPAGEIDTILDTTLADNGGKTLTHMLTINSPAIDKLTADEQTAETDQRGWHRVIGPALDIGAVEAPIHIFLPHITIPE